MNNFINKYKKEFFISVVVGFLIWALTPLANVTEPWDSDNYLYSVIFIFIFLGFMFKKWHTVVFGLYIGQVIYIYYTKIFFPSSEAATWSDLGLAVLTISVVPTYLLCGFGRFLNYLYNNLFK